MKKIFTQIAVAFGCLFLAGCDTVLMFIHTMFMWMETRT